MIHIATALLQIVHEIVHGAQDTIVTKQVASDMGFFQKISIIAQAMITFAALLIAVALFMGAWYCRGIYLKINRLIDRVDGIVSEVHGKIDHVNAFLGVVQEEVESAFVETAAAVRGVRTGFKQVFDHNEGDDDGDHNSTRTTHASPPAPRGDPQ